MHDRFDNPVLTAAGHQCRRVAALLIARIWPGRSFPEVLDQVCALPSRVQVGIVGGVLGVLFAAALIAAQFGPAGLAAYFLTVVVLVR